MRRGTQEVISINNYINKGMEFLYKSQLPYGEFKTLVFPEKSVSSSGKYISTTYITTFVLYSLSFINDDRVKTITEKALHFLQQEMEGQGIWRFFGTNRSLRVSNGSFIKYTPINTVPDLDDTACASYALRENGRSFADNIEAFLRNRNAEGVFQTWLLDYPKRPGFDENTHYFEPKVNDICCGVLSNILLYLGDNADTALSSQYICKVVKEGREQENIPYFPDRITLYYLISRAYWNGAKSLGEIKDIVAGRIAEEYKEFGSALKAAFVACTLLYFNCKSDLLHEAVEYIKNRQRLDGSWLCDRFFDEPVRCYGSDELTTAICLEALVRYERWSFDAG